MFNDVLGAAYDHSRGAGIMKKCVISEGVIAAIAEFFARQRSGASLRCEMQRVPEILQFPVIVERRGSLSLDPQPFQKFDLLLSRITAE